MQIQILAFLAVIGINFMFAEPSQAADTMKRAAGELVITVKGETRNETMKELMTICRGNETEIQPFDDRDQAVLCKISSDYEVPWRQAIFVVPRDSSKAATLIDLPDFFEPLISGKMALQPKGRADEKEPFHRRADRRHAT